MMAAYGILAKVNPMGRNPHSNGTLDKVLAVSYPPLLYHGVVQYLFGHPCFNMGTLCLYLKQILPLGEYAWRGIRLHINGVWSVNGAGMCDARHLQLKITYSYPLD